MTKEELKPIDVKRYKVTETGQVLKMTDEEIAEEWVKNNGSTFLHLNMSAYKFAEQAYLAGLKAGKAKVKRAFFAGLKAGN